MGHKVQDNFAVLLEMGHTLDLSFRVTCKEYNALGLT